MPLKAVEEIKRSWDLDIPHYLVHSLPVKDFFSKNQTKGDFDKPYRLVYAGGIMPRHIATTRGHGNHVFDPLICKTENLNLALTIFVNQNSRKMFWHEHQEYFELEKKYKHFFFKRGLPFWQLPSIIGNWHFGILYDNVKNASYRKEAFKYNMSTKVFSYLEAGLPILVYDEFEYITDFVREYNLGVVYSLNNIKKIPELLEKADYKKLKKNVEKFRENHNVTSIVPILLKAYELPDLKLKITTADAQDI